MRQAKRNLQERQRQKRKPLTRKEKMHLLRCKRKNGPAAVRRREHRHEVLSTLECGCQQTRVNMVPCGVHRVKEVNVDASEGGLLDCGHCGAKIHPHEQRTGAVLTTSSEPGYDYDGCILCVGDGDRDAAARDAEDERRMDEERA
jgi:hypothetical protein